MANWYVRPNGGSYGAEDGSDWTNAFDGFSDIAWASISAGDTIWVAGGTYTQSLSPTKGGSAGNVIAVRRARADAVACTGAAGWSAGFDSTITHDSASINILGDYNYLTFSGATTASGGAIGWHITFVGDTEGTGVFWGNGVTSTNVTLEWLDIEGPGNVTYSSDGRGIDATPLTGSSSALTVAHCEIHGWESTVYLAGISSVTFEYCEIYDVRAVNSETFHPNAFWILNSNDLIVRYCYLHGYLGEGIFWTNNDDDVSGALIYGNIFNNEAGGSTTKCLQPDNTGTFTGLKVWNNSFFRCYNIRYGDSAFASSEAINNLVVDNLTGGNPWTALGTETNNLSSTDDAIFVNAAGGNFNIVANIGAGYPRDAGADLSAFFTEDMNGNSFEPDWPIGALQYADEPSSMLNVTNLNVTTLTVG